jgi:hypothetical protein
MQTVVRETDDKGRVTLGKRYAKRSVIIEEISETEVKVTLARVIPEKEMWLWENPKARDAVLLGLKQLEEGKLSDPPDLDADGRFAEQLEE